MNGDGARQSPEPEFYVSPGVPVTCLTFAHLSNKDLLMVGSTEGDLIVYDCRTWKKIYSAKVFLKGMLWMQSLEGYLQSATQIGEGVYRSSLICQGRFESLKILELQFGSTETTSNNDGQRALNNSDIIVTTNTSESSDLQIVEVADFKISHEAFCKGLVTDVDDSCLVFSPSSTCSLIVSKLANNFIRPVVTLNPERTFQDTNYGAIMCCSKFTSSWVLVGYENCDIILWEWSSNKPLSKLNLSQCGTPMSLDCDQPRNIAAVSGSEKTVSVIKLGTNNQLEVLKNREITNPGLGSLRVRPDKLILAAGGWDYRIRIFSWKHPERLKPLAVLHFHTAAVEALAFTPTPIQSGRFRKNVLAAGAKDGKVSIWSLYNNL